MTADYDGWAEEAPEPPDQAERLVELVTQLAEHLGLSVGAEPAPVPVGQPVLVKFKCNLCDHVLVNHLYVPSGTTTEFYDQHVCMAGASATTGQQPSIFPFTLAVRSGT